MDEVQVPLIEAIERLLTSHDPFGLSTPLDHEDFPSSAMFRTLAALEEDLTAGMHKAPEKARHRDDASRHALGR